MMTRREFLKMLTALGLASQLPWSWLTNKLRVGMPSNSPFILDNFGIFNVGTEANYDGHFAQVTIVNRALSDGEIDRLFQHRSRWPETQLTQEMVSDAVVTLEDLQNFWEHVG